MDNPPTVQAALQELITTYHDLNSHHVEVRDGAPTAIEFLRDVMANRPVVYKGAASGLPASRLWNFDYLLNKMEGRQVMIAQTLYGNADSAVFCEKDGRTYFVTPHEERENFCSFLEHLRKQKTSPTDVSEGVKYSQSQNDNIQQEYSPLAEDVEPGLLWASEALLREPDATNIWIGNEKSVSAMHKDNYENLYCQIRGRKKFTLISPLEVVCVQEQSLPQAKYVPTGNVNGDFEMIPESPERLVHGWPVLDPDSRPTGDNWWDLCKPMQVVLGPTDVLYLPAMWYHKVAQESDDDGICCAVNFWYDMDYTGPFYPTIGFVRNMSLLAAQAVSSTDESKGINHHHGTSPV